MDTAKQETFALWSEIRFGHETSLTVPALIAVQDAFRAGDGFEASILGAMHAALDQGGSPLWAAICNAGLDRVSESEIQHRKDVEKTLERIESMKSEKMKREMSRQLSAKIIRQRTGELWRTWDIED